MKAAARSDALLLRDYSPRDLEQLCALDRQCFSEKVAFPRDTMRETIEEKDAVTIVAEDQSGQVVGFVVGGRTSPRIGHIATIDVAPAFRRRGLATRLMDAVEVRLAGLGVRKIRLETAKDNVAQRLFAKLGYERIGEIASYYPDGSDAWVMEKAVARQARGTGPL
jgi:ribosomal protein S18 acetylase RimI-like enzyme